MQAVVDRVSQEAQEKQIVLALRALPPEKVAEVWDFVTFLQNRYVGIPSVDTDDSWSDQDLRDLSRASLMHAHSVLWAEEKDDAEAG